MLKGVSKDLTFMQRMYYASSESSPSREKAYLPGPTLFTLPGLEPMAPILLVGKCYTLSPSQTVYFERKRVCEFLLLGRASHDAQEVGTLSAFL